MASATLPQTRTYGGNHAPILHGNRQNVCNCVLPVRVSFGHDTLQYSVTGLISTGYDPFNTNGSASGHDAAITSCGDGSYCCGSNNAACCDQHEGLCIVNGRITNVNPSTSTSTLSTSTSTVISVSTAVPSGPATSSSPSPTNQSSGLDTSGKVGWGVGLPVGIIALGLISAWLFIYRKRGQKRLETGQLLKQGAMVDESTKSGQETRTQQKSGELPGSQPRAELA